MIKLKKFWPIGVVIGLILLISLFIFLPYILNDKAFVIGYDMRTQYRPMYAEFRRLFVDAIRNFTLPFWSWNMFFGNNFWGAKVYYMIGDIYSYLGLLFDQHFYHVLIYLTGLKFIVAGLTFFIYGRIRLWSLSTRIMGSILFAFTSWSLK